jgi:hypothetical protein
VKDCERLIEESKRGSLQGRRRGGARSGFSHVGGFAAK